MNNIDLELASTRLDKHALLRIRQGQGQAITVLDGMAWITQDGDPRDVLIGEGESFTLDRPGLAIVQALEPTRLLGFQGDPERLSK